MGIGCVCIGVGYRELPVIRAEGRERARLAS